MKVIDIPTLTSAGNAVNSGSEVLDDRHGASLDGQDAGQLEDDVLRAGPAAQLTGQLDPDHLGALELPGDVSHHVHGVSAAHTDAETACLELIILKALRSSCELRRRKDSKPLNHR